MARRQGHLSGNTDTSCATSRSVGASRHLEPLLALRCELNDDQVTQKRFFRFSSVHTHLRECPFHMTTCPLGKALFQAASLVLPVSYIRKIATTAYTIRRGRSLPTLIGKPADLIVSDDIRLIRHDSLNAYS